MTSSFDVLAGWERSEFTAAGYTREVFRRGSGPGVVVVHEIPGITPAVAQFANDVVAAGFTVLMPSLVGTPGKAMSNGYVAQSMAKVCIAREFTHWALNETSPIIGWLRALARNLHQEVGGPGRRRGRHVLQRRLRAGDDGRRHHGGAGAQPAVDAVRSGQGGSRRRPEPVARRPRWWWLGVPPKAARCSACGSREDKLVGTRFDSLRTLLGDAFLAVELPSASKKDHSVLTEQRDEPSVQRVLSFFQEKLHP
jgi:hypothetical protein